MKHKNIQYMIKLQKKILYYLTQYKNNLKN